MKENENPTNEYDSTEKIYISLVCFFFYVRFFFCYVQFSLINERRNRKIYMDVGYIIYIYTYRHPSHRYIPYGLGTKSVIVCVFTLRIARIIQVFPHPPGEKMYVSVIVLECLYGYSAQTRIFIHFIIYHSSEVMILFLFC